MISKTRAARIAAFAGACAIATAVAPAGADEVKPVPTSCAGLNFTDPAGDQQLSVTVLTPPGPLESGHKTPDNTDILAGFFRYAPDASGKNVLTANIQVANLDNAIDQGSSGSTWYYYFDLGDATLQVSASLDGAGNWSYGYGNLGGEEGPGNNTIGDTTGAVYPGKDGIISIVVPAAAMGIDGKTLSSPYASSRVAYRAPNGSGAVPTADDGPDNQAGKTFKVVPCAEAGETTPVSTLPSVPVVTPDLGTAPVGPATLNLKVTAPKLSARKLRKTRSFAVRLQAGEQLSGLAAKLRKGSRTVGSGKLAGVAPGAGKLRVKLSRSAAKKLKKGTYTLAFSATKVDGRTASGTVAIRVAT
jgi:methionine-rich copper-binding protein CopC